MPSPVFAIDFETYYDKTYSLTKFAPEAYVRDGKFDPYLVALYGPGLAYVGKPSDAPWNLIPDSAHYVAHNARFDETVLGRCQELGLIPRTATRPFQCTADLSVFHKAGRSLADACHNLLGTELNKSVRKKMQTLGYKAACEAGLKEELHRYALSDAEHCWKLWDQFGKGWPEHEQTISLLNRNSGRNGIRVDVKKLEESLGVLETAKWEAAKLIPWDWEDNQTPLSPLKLARACAAEGIPCPASVAEDAPECELWLAKYGEKYPWIAALRRWRKAHGLVKKLHRVHTNLINGDIFPFQIKYFGAHSGRFSGDGGFNMQNMLRDPREGVDLRSHFIPREGRVFIVSDYSQIEPRILQWLAGNHEFLELCRKYNVYEAAARSEGKWSGGRMKVEDDMLYRLYKARTIACGYGMGAEKFMHQAKVLAGLDLTQYEAHCNVAEYRRNNPKVTALWARLNRDLIWSGQRGEPFIMGLPSGRQMVYRGIRQGKNGWEAQVEINGNHYKTYGGLLTENLCISGDAEILSDTGWKRLDQISSTDLVWDGLEFVSHGGLVDKGKKSTIDCHGIRSTPDHLFWCGSDWQPAEKACQLSRTVVAYRNEPYNTDLAKQGSGGEALRKYASTFMRWLHRKETSVDTKVRLRARGYQGFLRSPANTLLFSGVPAIEKAYSHKSDDPRTEQASAVCCLALDEAQMPVSHSLRVEELWWTGNYSMPSVAVVRTVRFGHATNLEVGIMPGPDRQQSGILPEELSLVHLQRERKELSGKEKSPMAPGFSRKNGYQEEHSPLPSNSWRGPKEGSLDSPKCTEQVYDLLNCGPRHQFAVRIPGSEEFLIAHNCQAIARDVMCEGMLRLSDAGYSVLFTVHDEIIIETDPDADQAHIRSLLVEPPDWLKGCPLDVEMKVLHCYE